MSFPVNVPIECVAVITPLGNQAPTSVTLVLTDPNNMAHPVSVSLASANQVGTYKYSGYFVPNLTGNWTRTWSAANLLTTSIAVLTIA